MTNIKNIDAMICDLIDTHVPVLFVSIDEIVDGEWRLVNYIVVPDKNKSIIFEYVRDGILYRVKSCDVEFETLLVEFSKKVLADQGGFMKLYGN